MGPLQPRRAGGRPCHGRRNPDRPMSLSFPRRSARRICTDFRRRTGITICAGAWVAAGRGRRAGGAGRDDAAGDDCSTGHLIRPAATFSPERSVGEGHREPPLVVHTTPERAELKAIVIQCRATLPFLLSHPVRHERGESRREGQPRTSSPWPSPPLGAEEREYYEAPLASLFRLCVLQLKPPRCPVELMA